MAIPHAEPMEVIDLGPLGTGLTEVKTTALFKTKHVEAIRLILPQGKELPEHKAAGEITVQCLEGRIAFTALGKTEELQPGQMLHLTAAAPHAVRALENSSVLLTILLVDRDTNG